MAIDVTIVRPKRTARQSLILLVAGLIGILLSGAVVMLLMPVVLDISWGYWQSVAAVYLARTLFGNIDYLYWTKEDDES